MQRQAKLMEATQPDAAEPAASVGEDQEAGGQAGSSTSGDHGVAGEEDDGKSRQ